MSKVLHDRLLFLAVATLIVASAHPGYAGSGRASGSPPNVVVILADDLGYSDLSCYGSEIQTPNLDGLAAQGLRYSQFYNTARCWPSRAAILTGYYAQQVRRDTVPGVASGTSGVRPGWARLLPEMLRPRGYRSYHSGKWHVDGMPLKNGFDHSYYVEDLGRYFHPRVLYEDDRQLAPVQPGSGYYLTTAIAEHGISYLKDHSKTHPDQPFFLFLAFNAPHFPLQALPDDIERTRTRYEGGWENVRAERWLKVQQIGLVSGRLSDVERQVGPPHDSSASLKKFGPGELDRPVPWIELTREQQTFQAMKMALHAAMVERMDREIGRVLEQIRAMNALENTLILFLSDNGASAEILVRDDGHDPGAVPGSAATHLCLGPGWSTVANTPFRRHKTWVHEGGIATPLIVHWPRGIAAHGELRQVPGHVIDLVPTILEVAGAARFTTWEGSPVPEPPGISLVSSFGHDDPARHRELWWEHEGNKAVRKGRWKLVAARNRPWELFDLASDRTETRDLARDDPVRVQELSRLWQQRSDEFGALARSDRKTSSAAGLAPPVKTLILPGESFLVGEHSAFIFTPPANKRRNPQPWIFYAPTLPPYPDENERWMHERFVAAGIAVAGIDVGEAYGSPRGRELFTEFYHDLTTRRQFAIRPCLLGRSRGGLLALSWAAENPDKVAGLAGIYPVFDLRSYPKLPSAATAFGLSVSQLEARLETLNPIERVGELANRRIPALLIHGDHDEVVPLKENSAEFAERYRKAGASDAVTLIEATGQGHNLWEGFFHSRELVDFAIQRARAGTGVQDAQKDLQTKVSTAP